MQHLQTDRTGHDHLRIVFNDRVIFLPLGNRATIGDVAQSLRDFVPRRYGNPVAIDVMFDVSPKLLRASEVKPMGSKCYADTIAEFDCTASREGIFMASNPLASNT
jgi:hypothetical protein